MVYHKVRRVRNLAPALKMGVLHIAASLLQSSFLLLGLGHGFEGVGFSRGGDPETCLNIRPYGNVPKTIEAAQLPIESGMARKILALAPGTQ